MMASVHNMSPYSYNGVAAGASGKLYVPVSPSSVIYAQFDHISGIAAKSGQKGVSVTKIQILNTLIENLSKVKTNVKLPSKDSTQMLSDKQVDVLIKNYQDQIRQAVTSQNAQMTLPGARPDVGALFNFTI
ncbi:MAG: hypothetical protein MJ169_07880 [Treponema sp.]|nr:hypothetical protein [Treponema sp.]